MFQDFLNRVVSRMPPQGCLANSARPLQSQQCIVLMDCGRHSEQKRSTLSWALK